MQKFPSHCNENAGYLLNLLSHTGTGTKQGPVAPEHKTFCVPLFFFLGSKLQAPWPSLRSTGQLQTFADQEKKGLQRPGRRSQETMVQPCGRVLVPLQGIRITISEFFCRTKPPTNENKRRLKTYIYPDPYLWPCFHSPILWPHLILSQGRAQSLGH